MRTRGTTFANKQGRMHKETEGYDERLLKINQGPDS